MDNERNPAKKIQNISQNMFLKEAVEQGKQEIKQKTMAAVKEKKLSRLPQRKHKE